MKRQFKKGITRRELYKVLVNRLTKCPSCRANLTVNEPTPGWADKPVEEGFDIVACFDWDCDESEQGWVADVLIDGEKVNDIHLL